MEKLNSGLSEWRIRDPGGRGLTGKIKGILARYEPKIWNVYRLEAVRPDFTREPVLTPLSNQAAFRLMRGLKQGLTPGAEARAWRGSPGRVFVKLNELLAGVPCYRLSVGRLESMRDRVLEVAGP